MMKGKENETFVQIGFFWGVKGKTFLRLAT
jgi:hypothetical protein